LKAAEFFTAAFCFFRQIIESEFQMTAPAIIR
jgi:hypothetical protein